MSTASELAVPSAQELFHPAKESPPPPPVRRLKSLCEAEQAELRELLQTGPRAIGIPSDRWSTSRLVQLLELFGVSSTSSTVSDKLRDNGYNFCLPRARESKLGPDQLNAIIKVLNSSTPEECGLKGDVWSRDSLAELVKQRLGLDIKGRWIASSLRAHGFCVSFGRPRILSRSQLHQLRSILLRSPRDYGYSSDCWTLSIISRMLEAQFAVRIPAKTVRSTLHRLKVTRPRSNFRFLTLSSDEVHTIKQALLRNPSSVGLSAQMWTLPALTLFVSRLRKSRCTRRAVQCALLAAGVDLKPLLSRHPGRFLTAAQLQELKTLIQGPPLREYGARGRWTYLSIKRLLKGRFNIEYQISSMPKLLQRLDVKLRAPPVARRTGI